MMILFNVGNIYLKKFLNKQRKVHKEIDQVEDMVVGIRLLSTRVFNDYIHKTWVC